MALNTIILPLAHYWMLNDIFDCDNVGTCDETWQNTSFSFTLKSPYFTAMYVTIEIIVNEISYVVTQTDIQRHL